MLTHADKKRSPAGDLLLRREGSNLRPSGYEPDELPLLYFAMWVANIASSGVPAKEFYRIILRVQHFNKRENRICQHFWKAQCR